MKKGTPFPRPAASCPGRAWKPGDVEIK